jgi:hypothetical protein
MTSSNVRKTVTSFSRPPGATAARSNLGTLRECLVAASDVNANVCMDRGRKLFWDSYHP